MDAQAAANPELLLAQQHHLALLRKRALLQQDYGLCFYKPHDQQDAFHRAGAFKHRLWEAGNRSGKSTGGVAEDCAWLLGERVWYGQSDPARTLGIPNHSVKGIVICADWDKVDEIFTSERGTLGKLWQMLPRGFVKSKRRNHSGAIELIECINGSTLRFDTVKSWSVNPGGMESSDFDFAHYDEPLPEKMWKAINRGLIDRDGKEWFALTPITEPWIHYNFYPARNTKENLLISGNKWAQRSDTDQNPYLPKEAYDDYFSTLKPDEVEARRRGIPLALSGLVFKDFSYERHVLTSVPKGWNSYDDPPANYTVYYAIDPHPQTPHHVLFMAVAPTGQKFLFDEIFLHCTIDELSRCINQRVNGRFVLRAICDPLGFISHPITNTSMVDAFGDNGIYLSKASKAREEATLRVQQELKKQDCIYVSPLLTETLTEFSMYCWDSKENKPKDENDHAMENLGRLVLESPTWVDPDGNKSLSIPEGDFSGLDLDIPNLNLD